MAQVFIEVDGHVAANRGQADQPHGSKIVVACDAEYPTHRVEVGEAIELGKRFGTTDSGGFINGILDRVARDLQVV